MVLVGIKYHQGMEEALRKEYSEDEEGFWENSHPVFLTFFLLWRNVGKHYGPIGHQKLKLAVTMNES